MLGYSRSFRFGLKQAQILGKFAQKFVEITLPGLDECRVVRLAQPPLSCRL